MSKKHTTHPLEAPDIQTILASNGINRTKVKTSILLELSKSHRPLSVADIHKGIGDETCDISTVFRAVTQFKDKGIVSEMNLGEGFARYEIVNPDLDHGHHHHHHVRCRSCGEIKHIEGCELKAFEKIIAKMGYGEIEHYLEFTGLCPECSPD